MKCVENIGNVDKGISNISSLVTSTVCNTKIAEVEKKISNVSCLVTTTVLIQNLGKLRKRYLIMLNILLLLNLINFMAEYLIWN